MVLDDLLDNVMIYIVLTTIEGYIHCFGSDSGLALSHSPTLPSELFEGALGSQLCTQAWRRDYFGGRV